MLMLRSGGRLTWGSVSSRDLHNTYYPTLDLSRDSYFLTAFALALLLLLSPCIGLTVISLPSSISPVLYYYIVGAHEAWASALSYLALHTIYRVPHTGDLTIFVLDSLGWIVKKQFTDVFLFSKKNQV